MRPGRVVVVRLRGYKRLWGNVKQKGGEKTDQNGSIIPPPKTASPS